MLNLSLFLWLQRITLLFSVCVLPATVVFAQSQQLNSPIDLAKLTEVLPPAPNAAELGKFGGIQVGLFTGTPNIQIPIWTVSSRKLKMPLTLNYSSSGIKVDEIASRAGTGWVLESGGVITRTVYGMADERSTFIKPPNSFSGNDYLNFLRLITNNTTYDSQQDMFSFNFMGISGRYVLDSAGQVIPLQKTDLKISQNFNQTADWNIKVVDGKGLQYFFGGTGATERTKKEQTLCGRSYDLLTPTAWYLKRVVDPGVDTIELIYAPCEYTYKTGFSQTITKAPVSAGIYCPCRENIMCPQGDENTICESWHRTVGVVLKEIRTAAFTTILLDYQGRIDIDRDSLVSKIRVIDNSTSIPSTVREINLNYTTYGSDAQCVNLYNNFADLRNRPFLLSVAMTVPGQPAQEYKLGYIDPGGMSPRISFSQDMYGYFNGVWMNTNLIYPAEDPTVNSQFNNFNFANRSFSPEYAMKGLLTKITYPTGGNDSLVYEGNDYNVEEDGVAPMDQTTVNASSYQFRDIVLKRDTITVTYNTTGALKAKLQLEATVYDPDNPSVNNQTRIKVYNRFSGIVLYENTFYQDTQLDIDLQVYSLQDYIVEVESEAQTVAAHGSATFYYQSGPAPLLKYNKTAAGLRIAKIITQDPVSGNNMLKRYYYARLQSLDTSSGYHAYINPANYRTTNRFIDCPNVLEDGCSQPVIGLQLPCGEYLSISSNSLSNVYVLPSGPMIYSAVVEGWGNDFENGGVEHFYLTSQDAPAYPLLNEGIPSAPLTNNTWRNGLETYQHTFRSIPGGIKQSVQKVYSFYNDDPRGKWDIANYVVEKVYEKTFYNNPPSEADFAGFNAAMFKINGNWTYRDSSRIVEIFNNGVDSLVTGSRDYYDNAVHLQLTRQSKANSSNEQELVVNKYPDDKSNLTNLTADASMAIDQMTVDNEQEALIETERYKAGILITRIRNNYKIWSSAGRSFTAPDNVEVQIANNPPEARVDFINYNQWENLTTQSRSNDVQITYLWDYKGVYPVAQITNATEAHVAYTSFESDSRGNWQFSGGVQQDATAPTGKMVYSLSGGNLNRNSLPQGDYTVMLWSRAGSATVNGTSGNALRSWNGWTLYRYELTGVTSVNISGSGYIDELRLHPAKAEMLTSAYHPVYGIISQCDAKGIVTYYEYDSFGRLKLIRDMEGKILKQLDYQYLSAFN